MRGGRKVVTAKRFFPGYILVEMNMSDNAWHVVKNTPKVPYRLRRRGRQAHAAQQRRSRTDPDAGEDRGREAEAEVHVREGRAGAHQRRAVHQLQRRGRRCEPRQEHVEGDGDDLRPGHAGRARFPAGGENSATKTRTHETQSGLRAFRDFVAERSRRYGQKNSSNGAAPDRGRQGDAGAAVGTALGPQGVDIMDFCKNFNARTAKDEGLIIPVVVTVFADRSTASSPRRRRHPCC